MLGGHQIILSHRFKSLITIDLWPGVNAGLLLDNPRLYASPLYALIGVPNSSRQPLQI
jgi:hypothetical protein